MKGSPIVADDRRIGRLVGQLGERTRGFLARLVAAPIR